MSFDNILTIIIEILDFAFFAFFYPPNTRQERYFTDIYKAKKKQPSFHFHLSQARTPNNVPVPLLSTMLSTLSVQRCEFQNQTNIKWSKQSTTRRSVMRKFHLPHGRTVATKAAGFLFRVRDNEDDIFQGYANGDFDGLIMSDKFKWDHELEIIRSMQITGKAVSILGMDSPDDFMPPTWIEIMQLKDAFISSGAKSVDYIHYEDDSFKIDM